MLVIVIICIRWPLTFTTKSYKIHDQLEQNLTNIVLKISYLLRAYSTAHISVGTCISLFLVNFRFRKQTKLVGSHHILSFPLILTQTNDFEIEDVADFNFSFLSIYIPPVPWYSTIESTWHSFCIQNWLADTVMVVLNIEWFCPTYIEF